MKEEAVAELCFHTTHEAADLLAYWLHEAGALGVMIVDPDEIENQLFDPDSLDYAGADFLSSLPPYVVLTAWFYFAGDDLLVQTGEERAGATYPLAPPVRRKLTDFIDALNKKLKTLHMEGGGKVNPEIDSLGFVSMKHVVNEDWADLWKQYAVPIRVGQRVLILPSWQDNESLIDSEDMVLRLDPGMAFGTGSHETTSQCLVLLESIVKAGDRVLDLGTGSGLLAMAAKKLGARQVVALDIDPVAVTIAGQNAAENGLEIETRVGSIDQAEKNYDLVLANIIYDVLVALKDGLYDAVNPGGHLIASGVLVDRADSFVDVFERCGFTLLRRQSQRDWVAFVFAKPA